MSVYVDSNALLKIYLDEPDSPAWERLLLADPGWVTGRHTEIEVRRNLARNLSGTAESGARVQFARDWKTITIVELDRGVCDAAVHLAETTGVRTLDALHLGAAQRAGGRDLPFLTADVRLGNAARSLGWNVLTV